MPAFLGLHLPYLFPILDAETQFAYGDVYGSLLLLPLIFLTTATGISSLEDPLERRRWRLLSWAFVFWWLNILIFATWPDEQWGLSVILLTDGLYGLYYVFWFLAAVPPIEDPDPSARYLRPLGTVALLLGLWIYLIAIPFRVQPDLYASWQPSFYLYVLLDLALTAVLIRQALVARRRNRRVVLAWLAATAALFAAVDFLEALSYSGAFELEVGGATDLLWNLPFIPLVLAVVLRSHRFEDGDDPEPEQGTEPSRDEPRARRLSPLMPLALALPLIHILGFRWGFFEAPTLEPRERWVLICLLVLGALATFENVALRRVARRAEAALAEAQELRVARAVAERSRLAKSHFLANISHEIRSPMIGVLGLSGMLLETELREEDRRYGELLQTSARGLLQTVDDLLELSKIEAGHMRPTVATLHLRQVVQAWIAELEPRAKGLGLRLEYRVDDDVPDLLITDGARMSRVVKELLSNALKFTEEGRVRLRVKRAEEEDSAAEDEVRLAFEVDDSGIGIGPELRERLFQPFAQGDPSTSRRYGGIGLGLAISRGIARALGGDLHVLPPREKGTGFRVEVPFTRPPEPAQ